MNYDKIDGQHFLSMVSNASLRLEEEKAYVDSLNVFPVPDGDTGTNMSMTFTAAFKAIENSDSTSIGEISKKMARGALMGARGNSGVILSQIFRGIAKGFEGKEDVNPHEFTLALMEGSKAAYRAVMRPTEGTILTVIREVGEHSTKFHTDSFEEMLNSVCEIGKITLDNTPNLLPPLKKANVVDSGGMGLLIILEGMRDALLNGFKVVKAESHGVAKEYVAARDTHQEITFGFCTEFMIYAEPNNQKFKDYLESMGDSIVYVGYENLTKVHIHTDQPGRVLTEAQTLGEITKIKIENMREQHKDMQGVDLKDHIDDVKDDFSGSEKEETEKEEYAFISVSMGEGIKELFEDLGVKYIISGGQTMNPSTQDLVDAVEKANANHIIILPNNKNIVMSANQARDISDKDVRVVETKSIPQAVTALTAFNSYADIDENIEVMTESLEEVKSGAVTYAVRDTEVDDREISQGDYLGLLEGKIKEVGKELYPLLDILIEDMVDEDSSSVTIFYGEDVDKEEFESHIEKLEEIYTDVDIMSLPGLQPLYYFIIAVE